MKLISTYYYIIFISIIIMFTFSTTNCQNKTEDYPDSYWIENAHLRPNPFIEKQVGGVVREIFEDSKGNLWFGTEDGPYRYNGIKLEFFDEIKNQFGQGVTIKEIVEDNSGNIWFGHTGGISKYNGAKFTNYNENDGLISDDVWSLGVDKNENIWVGTIDGVSRFNGNKFTTFEIPESPKDSTRGISSTKIIHSIFSDSKRNIWLSTNGGAYKYDGSKLSNISENDGLCNNYVNKILEDSHGNMLFGTSHDGFCVYDGTKFKKIEVLDELIRKDVWDIMEDSKDNIWISVKHEGIYKYDGNTITNYNKENGLLSNGIMTIFEDNQNRIWCGGLLGLFRLDGNRFVNVTREGPWD